jgi:hypothetical protein
MHKEIRKIKKQTDKSLDNLIKKDEKIDRKLEKCEKKSHKK